MQPAADLFACEHELTPDAVLRALRLGEAHGQTAARLAVVLTGRAQPSTLRRLRKVIEALRSQGHRICAHPNHGYYLAADAAELERACEFHFARAMTSLRQVSAMKRVALPDLRGQLRLAPQPHGAATHEQQIRTGDPRRD